MIRWLLCLCVCLSALSQTAQASIPDFDIQSVAERFSKIGGLLSSVGESVDRLGVVLEEGDVEAVKREIQALHQDVDTFATEAKDITGGSLNEPIDNTVGAIHGRLDAIERNVNEDNLEQARDEYRKLQENWSQLGDYMSGRATEVIGDKEEVKGWASWLIDMAYEWYKGE